MHTDHLALCYLMVKKDEKQGLLSGFCHFRSLILRSNTKKGCENQVVDRLSRLENEGVKRDELEIDDLFPNKQVLAMTLDLVPCFVDFENYLESDIIPNDFGINNERSFFMM